MDFDKIIIGLLFLLGGLIGNIWRRSAMEKKNKGTDYSTTKIIYSSWGLIGIGTVLIILGILNTD
jgi:lipoprotein signal peptidase